MVKKTSVKKRTYKRKKNVCAVAGNKTSVKAHERKGGWVKPHNRKGKSVKEHRRKGGHVNQHTRKCK